MNDDLLLNRKAEDLSPEANALRLGALRAAHKLGKEEGRGVWCRQLEIAYAESVLQLVKTRPDYVPSSPMITFFTCPTNKENKTMHPSIKELYELMCFTKHMEIEVVRAAVAEVAAVETQLAEDYTEECGPDEGTYEWLDEIMSAIEDAKAYLTERTMSAEYHGDTDTLPF